MFELLLMPFRIVWEVVTTIFDIAWGLISLVFGLVGGLIELAVTIAVISLIVAIIRSAFRPRAKAHVHDEPFVSFYDQEGTVE